MPAKSGKAEAKRPRWRRIREMTRAEYNAYCAEHIGEFIAVPLDDGYCFARYLRGIEFAFYDVRSPQVLPVEEIKRHRVLFIICGTDQALVTGAWTVIGQEPLEPELVVPRKYYGHPHGTQFVNIYTEGEFRPYAGEDLSKLEPILVWSQVWQVEYRLRKHFAGEHDDLTQKIPRELAERLYQEYWAKLGKSPPKAE